MQRFVCLTIATTALLFSGSVDAGKYNTKLNIGDQAPAWKELPGVDGKKHSLADLKEKSAVVVVFTCNSCPYAVDYEDRVNEFAKQHTEVAVVAINVNKVEEDSLPKMKERAKKKGFVFPYLYDDSQKIAKDFGATRTPEFFLLNKDRKVVYMGAMDDSPDGKNVTQQYLKDALEAALSGKKPGTEETAAAGCLVRFERKRRKPRKKN